MKYIARDRYHPGFGFLPNNDYSDWTCCICGYRIWPDEEYGWKNKEVCHEACLKEEMENKDEI